jgi:hypothetical protein
MSTSREVPCRLAEALRSDGAEMLALTGCLSPDELAPQDDDPGRCET